LVIGVPVPLLCTKGITNQLKSIKCRWRDFGTSLQSSPDLHEMVKKDLGAIENDAWWLRHPGKGFYRNTIVNYRKFLIVA